MCLFRALAVDLHETTNLETSTSEVFNEFLEKPHCELKLDFWSFNGYLSIVENVVEDVNENIFLTRSTMKMGL